jgi:hypothetical protein
VHVDRFALFGGAAGIVSGVALGPRAGALLVRAAGGAVLGQTIGILAHLAVVEKEAGPNKMLEEVKGSLPVKEAAKATERLENARH